MKRAAIVSPIRTAVGKFQGSLASLTAAELGAIVLKDLVARTKIDPERIDDVIFAQPRIPRSGERSHRIADRRAAGQFDCMALTVVDAYRFDACVAFERPPQNDGRVLPSRQTATRDLVPATAPPMATPHLSTAPAPTLTPATSPA